MIADGQAHGTGADRNEAAPHSDNVRTEDGPANAITEPTVDNTSLTPTVTYGYAGWNVSVADVEPLHTPDQADGQSRPAPVDMAVAPSSTPSKSLKSRLRSRRAVNEPEPGMEPNNGQTSPNGNRRKKARDSNPRKQNVENEPSKDDEAPLGATDPLDSAPHAAGPAHTPASAESASPNGAADPTPVDAQTTSEAEAAATPPAEPASALEPVESGPTEARPAVASAAEADVSDDAAFDMPRSARERKKARALARREERRRAAATETETETEDVREDAAMPAQAEPAASAADDHADPSTANDDAANRIADTETAVLGPDGSRASPDEQARTWDESEPDWLADKPQAQAASETRAKTVDRQLERADPRPATADASKTRKPARPERSAALRRRSAIEAREGARNQRAARVGRGRPAAPPVDAEAHAQRHAQRIEGNGSVVIDDALFALKEWSLLGLAIPAEGQIFQLGDRRLLELEIDLGDYAVNLDLNSEVVSRDRERIGWRFVDPTDTQRDVLRALAQASLSGQPAEFAHSRSISRNQVAETGRHAPTMTRFQPRTRRRRNPFGSWLSLPLNAVIIALAAGAAIYAITGGDLSGGGEPAPVEPPTIRANHAAVAVKRLALDAPFSGTVLEWEAAAGAAIDQNKLLVTMLTDDEAARRIIVKSPCDCYLARINVTSGETVDRLESLGTLYSRGSTGAVHALFDSADAPSAGDRVSVSLPYSGDEYSGVVEYVGQADDPGGYIGLPVATVLDDAGQLFARIRTTPALEASKAGDPAVVSFQKPVEPEAAR